MTSNIQGEYAGDLLSIAMSGIGYEAYAVAPYDQGSGTGDGGAILSVSAVSRAASTLQWYAEWLRELIQQAMRARRTSTPPASQHTADGLRAMDLPLHLVAIKAIVDFTGLSQERLGALLGVSRQTLNRWERGEPIASANRRRVFATREILERAFARHPSIARLDAWLDTPSGSDSRSPFELIAAGEFDRARLLALAVPSPRLARAPEWIGRPIPAAFQSGAEHRQEALPRESDERPDDHAPDDEPEACDDQRM